MTFDSFSAANEEQGQLSKRSGEHMTTGDNGPERHDYIGGAAQRRLDDLLENFGEMASRFVGYPVNLDYDYSALLPFMQHSGNNVGDPHHESNFASNSHTFEREVIGTFSDLMKIPRDQSWGYVTSGGTEGNLYGLYMGRELFPDGIVYFSEDTHYSVVKILRLLKARNIMVRSQDNGEVDYDDFYHSARINRDVPVIFSANIGTTMKGAVDDLDRVRDILDDLAITNRYIHADAALSGMILPFVDDPQPFGFDSGVGQYVHKRPQDDRRPAALRRRPDPAGLCLTHCPVHRVHRRPGYNDLRVAQLPGTSDDVVCASASWAGGISIDRSGVPRHGEIR